MKYFILLLTIVSLSSCGIFSPEYYKNSSFSKHEYQMITEGDLNGPMRVYKINQYSDSLLLRKKSKDVRIGEENEVLQIFVDRLLATVQDSMSLGVGIAAPQVGILKNIIWVQRFDKEAFPFEVYLNPVIRSYSEEKQDCMEGCLSIPDKTALTKNRSQKIILEYDQMDGTHKTEPVEGFTAVIFQHEIDHLHGILFTDHLDQELKDSQ